MRKSYSIDLGKQNLHFYPSSSLKEDGGNEIDKKNLIENGIICSTSKVREKRSVESCLTWEEIDRFNEGGIKNRDPDNIIIDSEKFLSSISNELKANEEKFSNFIALASESEVIGDYKNKVNMLTDNHRYLGHLEKVEKVSGMVMHGMIAKNVVGDLLRGDYKDVAINLGFLAGIQGLAKVAEAASIKGVGYMLEGRALLGKSIRFASPFLARGMSAFIVYDLYNQIKEYKKGNKDALVHIIGDSIQLGVDSATLGIEIGEGLGVELLEGASAVAGPIGMAIGAVVFVGTDVYMAVRTVEKIDEQIHLTGWEEVTEGTRAFFGLQPSDDIEDSLEEKKANNQTVKNAISFLKSNPYIQRYVFPSIGVNTEVLCSPSQSESEPFQFQSSLGCVPIQVVKNISKVLDNVVLLDQKRNDIKWSRTRPGNPSEGNLFCLPKGDEENAPSGGTYCCDGAIGVEYAKNRTGNYTWIDLGDGKDRVKGFQDSSNIFVLGDGHKEMTGGNKDDSFIFGEKSVNATYDSEIDGSIDGRGGIDIIDVGGLTPRYKESKGVGKYRVSADFRKGVLEDTSKVALNISNINQFLGKKGRVDQVISACDTKYMDGKGGENKNYLDSITIPKDDACFYDTKVIINPYTKVNNSAINGNFTYFIRGDKGKEAYIDLGPNSQSRNTFAFNYTLKDIAAIDKSEKNITFSFVEEFYKREKKLDVNSSFNLTVSGANENITTYHLVDNTKVVMGQNNVYAMQNTEKPIDSLVKDYSSIADKSQMYVIVRSKDEVLTVGHSHHDILMNDPNATASHLVGSGGENVFVITSGHEKLTLEKLPISDVIIYDFDQENKIDTLSLREIKEQLKKDIGRGVNTEVSKIDSDLLINLSLDDASKKEVVKIRLKGTLENNWYKRVSIVIDNVFVIEEILDDFELTPQPLVFDNNSQTIYVINPKDVVEGDRIRVKKEIGDYTFARDNDALVITNSLSPNVNKNNLSTIILNDFYHGNNQDKMQTLKIEFNDKKILLRKEIERINNAGNFSELKREVKIDSYKAVMYEIKKQKLFEAVNGNNIGEVKELIKHGVSIDARNNDGQTSLHLAVHASRLEMAKCLIEEKGANVNASDNCGYTPLHLAAAADNLEVVKYLTEKGADFKLWDNCGYTPLHLAAFNGQLEVVKYLIEEREADVNLWDKSGRTPLYLATRGDCNLDLIDYLLERKDANVNVRNNDMQTPLHSAAEGGDLEVVRYLIDRKGAKINVTDESGRTPLHSAAKGGNLEVVKYLIDERHVSFNVTNKSGRTPLHSAAKGGNLEVVKYLIEEKKGAKIDVEDNYKQTPLHFCAEYGKLKVVKYLVEKSANISAEDNYKQTPLHFAAINGHLEVVKYLVGEKGANISAENNYGQTPLHYAAKSDRIERVKYLIEEKGVNVKDNCETTLLHYAADHGKLEVVKYLVKERDADVDAQDNVGRTSLHYAADYGKLEAVKYLIEKKGTKIDVVDNDGKTPLYFAAERDNLEIVKYLIEKGANLNVTDNAGWTPLHSAADSGKLEMVKYLIEKGAKIDLKVNGKTPLNILESKGYKHEVDSIVKKLTERLFDAVKYDDFGEVQGLINQGISVNVKDSEEQTLLHCAVSNGKLKVVKYLIEKKGVDFNVKEGDFGWTLLHLAAVKGNLEVVKYFIERKQVDFNVGDSYKITPLHYAVEHSRLEVVKYLIEKKKADINVKDGSGKVPLHYAAVSNDIEVVKYLLGKKNANINATDNDEQTPLHFAAKSGNLEVVRYLIEEKEANFKLVDKSGQTPLHFAAEGGNLEVVRYLIEEKEANFKLVDKSGQTPLHFAAEGGSLEVVKYLIEEKKADFKLGDESGKTPLHYAAKSGNLEVVKYLIEEKKADFKLGDKSGKTPLDLAANKERSDVVEYLKRKLNEKREKPKQRKRRHHHGDRHHSSHRLLATDSSNQPEIATSNASQKSSWINDLVGWVKNSIGKLSSKPESTASSISQIDMQIDADGTIMLLDLLIRRVTGQKYIYSADQHISLIEAQGYALNIIEKFEKVLNEAAIKSGISAINLDFNPVKSQLAIVGQIRNGKFSEISKTLYSFAKEACPELEQTGKFLTCLKSNLEGEKEAVLLQQKVEQTSGQQISRKVVAEELPKKPDTLLNGISVVKGINNVLVL